MTESLFSVENGNIVFNFPRPTCRSCRHFVRVASEDESFIGVVTRVGFCASFREWGLYQSSSQCGDCYVYNRYAAETEKKEDDIKGLRSRLRNGAYDKRTKEYRAISECIAAVKKEFGPNPEIPIMDVMRDHYILNTAVDRYIAALCRDQILILKCRRHMREREYRKMIGFIQMTIFNSIDSILDANEEICVEEGEEC